MEVDELMDDDLFADLYGEEEDTPKGPTAEPAKQQPAAPVPHPAIVPQQHETSYPEAQQQLQEMAALPAAVQKAIDPRAPPASVNITPIKIENSYSAEDDTDGYSGWDAAAAAGTSGNTGGAGIVSGASAAGGGAGQENGSYGYDGMGAGGYGDPQATGSPAIKEDGKMFIGGLNWETTDESLKGYFSQYGEVIECTVMRDGPTGRSRGFGFLTFKDPKTVNIVMVKEHYLDGKIIDPKRAIPRDEQEKTSKIFVGGVSQEATEADFRGYFTQFGRVLDATLMMDKDTGRPRGFGFVTFDSEGAVENALNCPTLAILDKSIEVKKAQPRGNIRERMNAHFDDREDRSSMRDRADRRDRFDNNRETGPISSNNNGAYLASSQPQNPPAAHQHNIYNGISPQLMAQYYQNVQRYIQAMQTFGRGGGVPMPVMNPSIMQALGRGAMTVMNPAMLQQIQTMQALQQQQQQQPQVQQQVQQQQPQQGQMSPGPQSQQATQGGYGSPHQGYGNAQAGQQAVSAYDGGGYNEMQQQQQQQQQQHQQQQQQHQQQQQVSAGPYRQRNFQHHPSQRDYQPPQPQPSSWEGMYDDVPPQQQHQQQNRAGPNPARLDGPPPNAPTGPRNAKGSGSNYRGGGRGGAAAVRGGVGAYARGGAGAGGYHPYARNVERY